MRTTRAAMVLLGWTAFALLQCSLSIVYARSAEHVGTSLLFNGGLALLWAALTPIVWRVLRVLDRRNASLWVTALTHFLMAVVIAVLDTTCRRSLVVLLGDVPQVPFPMTLLYFADFTIVQYAVVVITGRVVDAESSFMNQTRRMLSLRGQLARARLEALEAQLQPHFLFNSLGTVMELAHESPGAAARMLRQIATLLSFAIEGPGVRVRVSEELAALEAYLDIQRIRFADWLTIERDVDQEALDVRIPRLTLQPLVENALQHGLAHRTERGRIEIRARCTRSRLVLSVMDNGVGLRDDRERRGHGIGLSNVKERLRSEYADDFTFELSTRDDGETVARIEVPLERAAESENPDIPASESAHEPRTQFFGLMRRYPIMSVLVGWTFWGALWFQQSIAYLTLRNRFKSADLPMIMLDHVTVVAIWVVLTPFVLLAGLRWPFVPPRVKRNVLIQLTCAATVAIAHVAAWSAINSMHEPLLSWVYASMIAWDLLLYAVLSSIAQFQLITDRRQERHAAASRLESELYEQELSAATTTYRPRETLMRLEQLAMLALHDPAATEHGISDLADEMRSALDRAIGGRMLIGKAAAGAA